MRLGNPVNGLILPHEAPPQPGKFRVTATFGQIDSFHPPPGHHGIDIGNGTCGFEILAVDDGRIDEILTAPNGAKIVRYQLTKFPGYQAALAHMDSFETKLGVTFSRGAVLGHAGKSGTTACHLHGGMRLNGVEIDWWPLLEQNQPPEQETDLDPSFAPKPNRTVTVLKGARHRLGASTTAAVAIASDPGGPLGFPLMGTVVGEAVNGNAIWYAYWRPETKKVYYLHTSACGPETPWEATDCKPEVDAALAKLNAKIDLAQGGS